MTQHMNHPRRATAVVASGMVLALLGTAAQATTQYETLVLKANSPHVVYGGGVAVKVHRTRLEGYFEGKEGNAAALAALKNDVQACMKSLAGSGVKLNPPSVWPDHVTIVREEQYATATRRITYTSGATHAVDMRDCSLLSRPYAKALLASGKGVCQIDLVAKKANGECGPGGHADARPVASAPARPPADMMKRLAANPAFAAAMPQMLKAAAMAPVRGAQHTVAGVHCRRWTQPIDDKGTESTLCYAIGGSFLPLHAVDKDGFGGLLLESTTPEGVQLKAVDARLDTEVGGAVFAPYLHSGFAINADRSVP
jgi:hypothetical protein